MFKRKLSALDYPEMDSLNINDENQFRKIIVWLEKNKIKKYKEGDSKGITNVQSSDWYKEFEKYKTDLMCPVKSNDITENLEWFLQHAIILEYCGKKEVYEKKLVDNNDLKSKPTVIAENPLDHLDVTDKEFEDGIKKIAEILKITNHPNPLVTLKAISKTICNRLNDDVLANPSDFIVKGTPFPFEDADLGFDLGDPVLNRAAKILRLLYIQDLRNLQTNCNELIVAVQNITANPKTDTKLGKVGK